MLNQISVGRVFGEEQPYLKPMNQFLATSSAQFTRWIYDSALLPFFPRLDKNAY